MTLIHRPVRPNRSGSFVAILLLSCWLGCAGEAVVAPDLDEVEAEAPLGQEASTGASARDAGARDATIAPDGGSDAGAGDAGDPELEALRQLCVDEINRYRATVGAAPLARASDREACSDRGAQLDGDTGRAHGSAGAGGRQGNGGYCPAGAQNTCPSWPVGGRSGNATVADALKGCLKMMWAEGKPPTSNCSGTCFMQHGHYLNMSAPATKRVACGFYRMKNGSYWLNQNFW
ncbi:MAG: CAP domain-containing protein [Polyangiales bacterium]